MATLRKHRKQWIILPYRDSKIPDRYPFFQLRELARGIFLYHDLDLKTNEIHWPDGTSTLILGLVLGHPQNPSDLHYQTGRFVAITNSVLSLDATGSMGVYFASTTEGLVCSSSQVLIAEILNRPLRPARSLRGSKMNWDPVPLSRVPGASRLITDQTLNLATGTTGKLQRAVPTGRGVARASENLATILVEVTKSLEALDQPIYLPLTGGTDSRAVLSALLQARVKFQAFTMLLGDERSAADAKVAARICKKYGVVHSVIDRQGDNTTDVEIYRAHCGGVVGDRGELYALGNYYRHLPDGAVILHGGAFEIGQRFYEERLASVRTSSIEETLHDLNTAFGGFGEGERDALREWLEYRERNPIVGVDFVDSFYIDQRRGGWGAANSQEAEVFGVNWLTFANSWSVVSEILSVTVDDRRANRVQIWAMDLLTPGISAVAPINPHSYRARWRQINRLTKSTMMRLLKWS